MFCLEGGTSEDPLFHSGCACRPDSGMGVGHIKCFQEFARASFNDEKKQQRIDCGIDQCSHCFQSRNGILRFEMFLILSKLYDPDSLTRQSIQDIDNAFVTNDALVCLNWVLVEADHIDSAPSHVRYSRLRILLLMKDVNKQNHYPDNYYRIKQVFAEDKQIGNILIDIRKYQAAIDYNSQSYEKFCDLINQYPALKSSRSSVVHTYARSLFEIYIAFLRSDIGIDPPYHCLEVAERLMREEFIEHPDDLPTLANNTCLLCSILMCQNKHTEAKQILSPCIEKSQRVLGPSHMVTKHLLAFDARHLAHI